MMTNLTLPKDLIGLDEEMIESIYRQAYLLYNAGKYSRAIELFRALCMLNPADSKFLLGLAACFHMLKQYKGAIDTYALCAVVNPESPIPYYHSSDCYLKLDDAVSASIALELAIKRAADKPEFKKMYDRALMTLKGIKESS